MYITPTGDVVALGMLSRYWPGGRIALPQWTSTGRLNFACCALSGRASMLKAAANPTTVKARFGLIFMVDTPSSLIRGTFLIWYPYKHADENLESSTLRCELGNSQEGSFSQRRT